MQIMVGYDPRESAAFDVACHSIKRRLSTPIPVQGLYLHELRAKHLYSRPVARTDTGQMWDVLSDAPMSTEFAVTRFLTPHIAKSGWALFVDCDVLARTDLSELFALTDDRYAVMCVQHQHRPILSLKMDGQQQTRYVRKNWSSVALYNCDHPANQRLTLDMINTLPGRDLHRFCWLLDDEIGALPEEWNWLVGHSDARIDPKIAHYTDGHPMMAGYETAAYADEWRAELRMHNAHGRTRRAA